MHRAEHSPFRGSDRPSSGFTIVEVMVAVAVTVVIGVIFATLQRDLVVTDGILRSTLEAQLEARKTLKDISLSLRTARSAATGAYPVASAGQTAITYYADTDGDSITERHRYFLDGTELKHGVIVPSGFPLAYVAANETVTTTANDVTNGTAVPVFQYFPATYDGTTPPLPFPVQISEVRLVRITVMIDRNGDRPPGEQTYTTQVMLRTLKDNL